MNIGNKMCTGKNGQAKKTTAASITLYNKYLQSVVVDAIKAVASGK